MSNLNSHITNIQVVSFYYWEFKNLLSQDLFNSDKSIKRFLNWEVINPKFSFWYNYVGCEDEIKNYLLKSPLAKKERIIMTIAADKPIISMKTSYFIENWYDFISMANHLCIVWSDDKECIMEFNYYEDRLFSNFGIKTGSRIYND